MSQTNTSHTKPLTIRRKPSFANGDFTRRKSFLSKTMLENDSFQSYELPSHEFLSKDEYVDIPTYSLSLKESQGFIWNQDLFASTYQQQRAGISTTSSYDGSNSPVKVIDILVEPKDKTDDTASEISYDVDGDDNNDTSNGYVDWDTMDI